MRRPRRAFEPASRAFRITRNQKLEDAAAVLRRLSFPGVLRRRATHAPDRSSFQLRPPSSTDRIEGAWHRHSLWRRPSTATSPPQRRCVPCHWFRSDNVAPKRVLRRRFPPEFPPVGSSRGLESGAVRAELSFLRWSSRLLARSLDLQVTGRLLARLATEFDLVSQASMPPAESVPVR